MVSPSWKKKAAALASIAYAMGMFGPSLSLSPLAAASSHREAPLIASDPEADITDVYFFRSPDNQNTVTAIMSVWPFEEPAGGPNFFKFGDNVFYRMNFDTNGDAKPDVVYEFDFETLNQNRNSALITTSPITDLNANNFVRQVYSVRRITGNNNSTVLASNLPVVPSYIGRNTEPNFSALFNQAISTVGNLKTFAGQTDDAFQVDLAGIFDLLSVTNSNHADGLKGYNVQSIALQIPISDLTTGGNSVVGYWATTSRPSVRVLSDKNAPYQQYSGDKVQISRLGNPLVNEVVIPLTHKDRFNASKPQNDSQFGTFVTNPELAVLFNVLFGLPVPPTPRNDLVKIYLTGVPGLNQPANVVPSEQMRLNVTIPVSTNPNVLGVAGGDLQGYPNGRRLFDDVTDISLKAVAGALYPVLKEANDPVFVPPAAAGSLSDAVGGNDKPFTCTFPFIAQPHEGFVSVAQGNAVSGANVAPACSVSNASSSSSVSSSSTSSTSSSSSSSVASSSSSSSTSSSSSISSSSSVSSVAGVPTCNGQVATIYVNAQGVIVGGNYNGAHFSGFLDGTNGPDVIVGTSSNDTIFAGNADDLVCAGAGHDYVNGGNGIDTVYAENGNDTVDGANGDDKIYGGEGQDVLGGQSGNDFIDGGNGFDSCSAESKQSCES